jgi:hypothetical protein
LRQQFESKGVFPDAASGAPGTYANINRMAAQPTPAAGERAFTGFDNLNSAREAFAGVAGNYQANPRDRLAATQAINLIDRFIANPPPASVLAGPASEAGKLAAAGRGNYSAYERSKDLFSTDLDRAATGISERADLGANVGSATNRYEDKVRQAAAAIKRSPKEVRGWTDPELDAITQLAEGTPTRNILRRTTGLGAIAGGSAALGVGIGPWAAPVYPAIGYSLRGIGNLLARRELRTLDEATRRRSPLFLERQNEAGMVGEPIGSRGAVLRALLDQSFQQ